MNFPRQRLFWAVGLGHMTNDIFISMGPVILAFLSVTILPMTNTQIGLTISATQLIGAVSQPMFGLMADRSGGRLIGAGGVAWTVGFLLLALVGAQTGYFWLMFIPLVLRAIGSGAFHPVGAMHASDSDKDKSASNTAYFFLMGQLGLALGPILAGILLDAANPSLSTLFTDPLAPVYDGPFIRDGVVTPIFFLAAIAVPVVVFMATTLPSVEVYNAGRDVSTKSGAALGDVVASLPWKAFAILGLMVGLRSLAQPGSVAFIPVLFQDKGWSPSEYGAITSSFWVASAISGVIFGNLADRYDRRWVVSISMVLSAPMFFFLPIVNGPVAFALAILAGGLSGGSHSIIVVLAQELIPAAKGFASGMILGFIFGVGALGSTLIGAMSDIIGLGTTFQLVAGLVVLASIVALALPTNKKDPIIPLGGDSVGSSSAPAPGD